MTESVQKKHRLSELTFEHEGAHIALVSTIQGGPANQQETVLWKSKGTSHITQADVESVLKSKSTPEKVEMEKANFVSEVRSALREELEKQYAGKYEWLYLEDFSDSEVVFSSDAGMFIVSYSLSTDDKYTFSDTATGVEYKSILVENGSVKLSKDAQEKLSEGGYSLVTKALDNPETSERVKDMLTKHLEKAKTMQEEIQKAVDAAVAAKTAEIEALKEELTKASDALAVVAAEKHEAVMKARLDSVSTLAPEDAQSLVKATEALSDEAFATIVKSMSANAAAVEESSLMTQVSKSVTEATEQAEESATVKLIKARAGK